MDGTRRKFFQDATLFGAGLLGLSARLKGAPSNEKSQNMDQKSQRHAANASTRTPRPLVPVITPDLRDLSFEMDGPVKVFRLKAEPLKQKIAPFKTLDVWGYNGSSPGPTIQVTQGDRVRIIVENALPESTSMHWHGLEVPIEQDGVPWISQKPIPPGATYTYEFTVHQEGTFFYHAHRLFRTRGIENQTVVPGSRRQHLPVRRRSFRGIEQAVVPSRFLRRTDRLGECQAHRSRSLLGLR